MPRDSHGGRPIVESIRDRLGLARNLRVTLAGMLIIGMAEELWTRFMPKYLESLGAGIAGIALYGTSRDLLDSIYQYPGGWIADRLGRSRSLVLFTILSAAGYGVYYFSRSWEHVLFGTVLAAAWTSLAQPAIFSVVGDSLPSNRRSVGFGVQAVTKRIPVILGPLLGGWIILRIGLAAGMKTSFLISIVLAAGAVLIIRRYYAEEAPRTLDRMSVLTVWRSCDPRLKRLLLADCLIRWAEGMPGVYIVLFVINVLGYNALTFGLLTSVQTVTSIASYVPVSLYADRGNRKPFVLATFIFFASFPLLLGIAHGFIPVALAFVTGGLRELGEPARKAMIVDMAEPDLRGRTIGLYYLLRGLAVFPASLAGGCLWAVEPRLPFIVASGIGFVAVLLFALFPQPVPPPPTA